MLSPSKRWQLFYCIYFIALGACSDKTVDKPNIIVPTPERENEAIQRISLTFDELSRLKVDGKKIVNSQNEEAVLRAIGLGNWALQEGYMLHPQGSDIGTQWQMKKKLYDEGQTEEQVEIFYQTWRDNFITKEDIDYLASLGFNSVRLPMHYELFLSSEQRAVRNSVIKNLDNLQSYTNQLGVWYDAGTLFNNPDQLEGFKMIDRLLDWCHSNHMYVVLDLHAAPGGQGADKNIADIFEPNGMWYGRDAQNRLIYQDVTVKLWESIALRYKEDDRIALYNLINEPNQVPDNQWIRTIKNRIVETIRSLNDTHVILIEGNGWGNNYDALLPNAFSNPFNLAYSAHRYWIPEEEDNQPDPNPNQINRLANLTAFRDRVNVPVWVGETGENTPAWLRQNILKLEKAGIGWCHWTYKRHDVNENAAIMRIPGNYPADGAQAMDVVLESIKFKNCIPNNATIAAVAPNRF